MMLKVLELCFQTLKANSSSSSNQIVQLLRQESKPPIRSGSNGKIAFIKQFECQQRRRLVGTVRTGARNSNVSFLVQIRFLFWCGENSSYFYWQITIYSHYCLLNNSRRADCLGEGAFTNFLSTRRDFSQWGIYCGESRT